MAYSGSATLSAAPLLAGVPRRLRIGTLEALTQLCGSRRRSRGKLLDLDAHRVSDVGITRAAALREVKRSVVWNAPDHWLR